MGAKVSNTAREKNGLVWQELSSLGLRHGFFERSGGVSKPPYASLNTAYKTLDPDAEENRRRVQEAFGLADKPWRILNPCHGEKIAFIEDDDWDRSWQGVLIETEAAFTRRPGSYFFLSTADCLPVIITDLTRSFVGLAHLGWRSLAAGFTGRLLEAACKQYHIAPSDLIVAAGPAIHACCYVFEDPVQKNDPFWAPFLLPQKSGKFSIDLIGAFQAQTTASGVSINNILDVGICTGCETGRYFSCYREGYVSGRFPTVVGLER